MIWKIQHHVFFHDYICHTFIREEGKFWAKLAKETLSPKFERMNSESLLCNSSGVGNGGFWFKAKT